MKIAFMGRSNVLFKIIEDLYDKKLHHIQFIWTSKAEKYYQCTEIDFRNLARKIGCSFFQGSKISDFEEKIDFKNLDLIISINFVNIIPKSFLSKVKFGILNAHLGDLPRYKGNACPNWAILNEEKKIFLTIHQMSEELDSGPIFFKSSMEINNQTYITEIYNWFERVSAKSFFKVIEMIENSNKPKTQRNSRSLRTFPRKPQDSKIKWDSGVFEIHKLIRASSRPFDGAFCYLNNDKNLKVTIYKAEIYKLDYDFFAVDGQILELKEKAFLVSSNCLPLLVTDFEVNDLDANESLKVISSSLRNRLT